MIDWLERHLGACTIKASLGFDCPACGMQRAFIALLKGDLPASLHYHPALIPLLLTFGALIAQLFMKHPKGGWVVMWLFILTSAITIVNFAIRQYLFYTSH